MSNIIKIRKGFENVGEDYDKLPQSYNKESSNRNTNITDAQLSAIKSENNDTVSVLSLSHTDFSDNNKSINKCDVDSIFSSHTGSSQSTDDTISMSSELDFWEAETDSGFDFPGDMDNKDKEESDDEDEDDDIVPRDLQNGSNIRLTNSINPVNESEGIIALSSFEGLTLEVFGTGPLAPHDVRYLQELGDYFWAVVFKRNNKLIYSINSGPDKGTYVWNHIKKLWVNEDRMNAPTINVAITETMMNLIERAMYHKQLSTKEGSKLLSKCKQSKCVNQIKQFAGFDAPTDFMSKFNDLSSCFPIKDGKKINIVTKQVSIRTRSDYFSYELPVNYLSDLKEEDNIFAKFLRGVWIDEKLYKFWRYIHAVLMLGETHRNYLILWLHHMGGGGKTIWMNALSKAIGTFITKLDRDIFFRGCKRNIGFELSKMSGKRIAYVDEVATDSDAANGCTINLKVLLDITGGGYRSELDKYQKAKNMVPRKQTATLVCLGNFCFVVSDKKIDALKRRIICCVSKAYFRAKGSPLFNENDPFCFVKDETLAEQLDNNPDHTFTFLINCIAEYIADGKPDLHEVQPAVFEQEWDNLNGQADGCTPRLIEDFLTECSECEGAKIRLTEFTDGCNQWIKKKYGDTGTTIHCEDIKALFKEKEYGNRCIINTHYLYDAPPDKTRKYFVCNILLPEQ